MSEQRKLIAKLCKIWFTQPTLDKKTIESLNRVILDLGASEGIYPENYQP